MTEILDNLDDKTKIGLRAQQYLHEFLRMDVATGYFNLRGWRVFANLVQDKIQKNQTFPVVRILIGMVQRSEHDEILDVLQSEADGMPNLEADREVAQKRREVLVRILRAQLEKGLPTSRDRDTLKQLYSQVQQGAVEIKVFCRKPLHGKTYIFHRDDVANPIAGFVGSSNLTYPGLMSNLELNTDVTDSDGAEKLAKWFEDRWKDRWSLPVKDELLEVLDESWASPEPRSPYDVYLKVCYDLSKDVREGNQYAITRNLEGQLLDYQATAVKTLTRRIMTQGGTLLGDVVGLGKTLTAIAVACALNEEYGYQPLVVCPKNLQKMWIEHLKAYDLYGTVVPYSMSHTLADLRRYHFVIVDESHTLRNQNTSTYRDVRDYITRNESKALLLTATPFNIDFQDVANQLGLFIDENDDLGIQPVVALSQNKISDRNEFGLSTLAAFRNSDEPEDWKRLMGEHLIRRTRTFVKNNYARTDATGEYLEFPDGSKSYFPKRVPKPVDLEFDENDPARLMIDDETLDAIASLQLPRYNLYAYVSPEEREKADDDEKRIMDNWERGRGMVAGFVRTSFYKRLSSCGHSFILSLKRHLERNELYVYALDNDLPLPIGAIDPSTMEENTDFGEEALDTALEDEETEAFDAEKKYWAIRNKDSAALQWLPAQFLDDPLREDLERDNAVIRSMLARYGTWSMEKDSKLRGLVRLTTQTHPNDKVLIFTEYKDTAKYLGRALKHMGVDGVEIATGDTKNPTAIAERFSPKSNALLIEARQLLEKDKPGGVDDAYGDGFNRSEVRVLVSTDVLSEGQNLQDAHIVVNYDLPWAIIRLIQRAGRVDRIGQESDEILVYTVSHGSVETQLNLRERVKRRLKQNALTFGSDEMFFSEEDTAVIRDLYNGKMDDLDSEEDTDAASVAYEIWTQATKDNPELAERIANLPDLIDATRSAKDEETEKVAAHVQTESGRDSFAWIEAANGAIRVLTGHEALRVFKVEPSEPGLERMEHHDAFTKVLMHSDMLRNANDQQGRLRGERKWIWQRFSNTLDLSKDTVLNDAIESVYHAPLTTMAVTRLRSAKSHRVGDEEILTIIRALYLRGELVLDTREDDRVHIVSQMGVRK